MPDPTLPVEYSPALRFPRQGFIERPVVFRAGSEELSGVYCEPVDAVAGRGVVLLSAGGFIASTHRNRMWVRLARRLAEAGWGVLRFDYHGVGESTGEVTKFWLDQPFVQDVDGAVQWMRDQGVAPGALVGSCFGARTILAVADRIPELEGVVLLSLPLASDRTLAGQARRALPRVWRRMWDPGWRAAFLRLARARLKRIVGPPRRLPRARGAVPEGRRRVLAQGAVPEVLPGVSPGSLGDLQGLLARPVRVLMLYGIQEDYYLEFQRALGQGLERILGRAAASVDVRTVAGVLHGFTTLATQEFTIATTVEWMGNAPRDASPSTVQKDG